MILSAKSCLFALSFVLSFLSSVFCFALHLHGSSSSFKGAAAGINSRLSMVIYDEDGGTRNLVTSSTQILVAPFSVIRMDELEAMRKELLNKKTKTKIISRSDMIEAVDGKCSRAVQSCSPRGSKTRYGFRFMNSLQL